ncbi:MAG: type II toxin-antitoxin system RelE/ParE family toxin [Bacteroidales bacterium]
MINYSLTNKAAEDLAEIWNYTFETWSEKQADNYYHMLLDSCQDIALDRVRGMKYEGLIVSVLGVKVGRHIIFYRKAVNNKIEILRILHEKMDLKNRIKEK